MVSAVFLDRDGVINANIERDGRPVAPTSLQQFHILPGVAEATAQLKAAGFLVIVVTNQPDVAVGRTPQSVVEAMNEQVRQRLGVDDVRVCYHVDADNCACRKPKPGMILEAAAAFGIDPRTSYMIGDRWRDIEAGRRAGCFAVLVGDGLEQEDSERPDKIVASLPEAAGWILEVQQGRRTP
jgi:D-glycero-D-manno-heptose 1,7-bisphosphate phosphatase